MGEIEHEGARKIMCGPRTSLEARSSKYVVIMPGDKKNTRDSARLANVFEVPEEEIYQILPPGSIKIVEEHGVKIGD